MDGEKKRERSEKNLSLKLAMNCCDFSSYPHWIMFITIVYHNMERMFVN